MINPSDERLSALVDGELDEQEYQATVVELLAYGENRKTWGRYHLIGDTLKRNLPKGMDYHFSSRVMAALEDEPTVLAPPSPVKSSWGQRAAGLAVAASVAVVAVLGVQLMHQQDEQTVVPPRAQVSTQLLPQQPQNIVRANTRSRSQSSPTMGLTPKQIKQFHPRLNKYLVDHNQQAPRAAVQGMIPYARIVAYPNSHRLLIQTQK